MLAVLTQRLAEKIFARQRSGRQQRALSEGEPPYTVPSVAKYSHKLTWKHPHPQRFTQTCRRAARMDAHAARWAKPPSKPPDEKTPPHKWPLLMQGEALLFGRTMSVLTFLCLHIFKHQKQQKEGGEREKKKSDRHANTTTDMFRLIQDRAIS